MIRLLTRWACPRRALRWGPLAHLTHGYEPLSPGRTVTVTTSVWPTFTALVLEVRPDWLVLLQGDAIRGVDPRSATLTLHPLR